MVVFALSICTASLEKPISGSQHLHLHVRCVPLWRGCFTWEASEEGRICWVEPRSLICCYKPLVHGGGKPQYPDQRGSERKAVKKYATPAAMRGMLPPPNINYSWGCWSGVHLLGTLNGFWAIKLSLHVNLVSLLYYLLLCPGEEVSEWPERWSANT